MARDFAREHEAALAENAVAKAKVQRQYSVREAIRRATEIVSVFDETLGKVRFGVLNIEEFQALELAKYPTKEEMLQVVVAAMLRKADSKITLDSIKALPADDYTILASIVGRYLPGFLRLGQQILRAHHPAGKLATKSHYKERMDLVSFSPADKMRSNDSSHRISSLSPRL